MKDYLRIRAKLYGQPCLITPAYHRQISEALEAHRVQAGSPPPIMDKLAGNWAEPPPTLKVSNGTGVIAIHGVISKDISGLERACGAVGVEDIEGMISEALADPDVTNIVLDVDSPGGGVTGVAEVGDMIAAAAQVKPVIAYTSGMMASAAYWMSAGATAIYASGSSMVGSIGTYLAMLDTSRAAEMQGVKVDLIKAGKFKGAGYPGTELTAEQRQQLQDHVDEINGAFTGFVSSHRPSVESATMEGQIFSGTSAQSNGLVDSVTDLAQAITDARALAHQGN